MDRYEEFQQYVKEYMNKLPKQFEVVFEEFYDVGYVLDSVYKGDIALIRVNTKEWDGDTKWYAKMAVLLFLEDYFNISHNKEDSEEQKVIDKSLAKCFYAITYLIP